MTFDFTINIGTMVTLIVGFGAGIAAWVTALNRISGHDAKLSEDAVALAKAHEAHKLLSERVESIRAKSAQELADFKLEVAKNYATNSAIREVEERIVVAIDRLGDRLDKIIDRQDHPPGRRTA
ncbi:hypothetical protein [Aminobacter niigataensis]|uniref:hypothetical protein n=1 Tax=Aminobacter niigataensis TaxID=83265 RepID=UPI0024CA87D2|nr:hypothetical protein [Aminobacter niigataensis]CAI2936174.1 conserved protein of unknown function [Aminobacter niigataensis]